MGKKLFVFVTVCLSLSSLYGMQVAQENLEQEKGLAAANKLLYEVDKNDANAAYDKAGSRLDDIAALQRSTKAELSANEEFSTEKVGTVTAGTRVKTAAAVGVGIGLLALGVKLYYSFFSGPEIQDNPGESTDSALRQSSFDEPPLPDTIHVSRALEEVGEYEQNDSLKKARKLRRKGDRYYYGIEVEENEAVAFHYYKEALEQEGVSSDKAWACARVADICYHGTAHNSHSPERGARDFAMALSYYSHASQQELNLEARGWALRALGDIYYYAHGVTKDLGKAREFYQQASAQCSSLQSQARALKMLGDIAYETLKFEEARHYYEAAAQQRYDLPARGAALKRLGDIYAAGLDVEQSWAKAREYYERVIPEQLFGMAVRAAALKELGDIYYQGHGVGKDSKKAHSYFQEAAAQNYDLISQKEALQRLAELAL